MINIWIITLYHAYYIMINQLLTRSITLDLTKYKGYYLIVNIFTLIFK